MGERLRESSIAEVREVLESAGFFVSDAHTVRPSSFDLVARRDSTLLIVKVLKNIDALDQGEADRLRELGALFPAVPLVVGRASGSAALESGVVYNRYGIPVVILESLSDYLLKGLPPFLVSSPGGVFARIDGPRLRALREERRISLGGLAGIAGVSRRTIQLYEDGGGAEIRIVQRLERYLGEPLAVAVDLFAGARAAPASDPSTGDGEDGDPDASGRGRRGAKGGGRGSRRELPATGDALRDGVFRQLDDMGWEVVVTVRCPFDAFTQGKTRGDPEEVLLTSVGNLRTAQHRAELLRELARVIEGHAVFVVQDASRSSVDGLPLVTVRELARHRDRDEFFDLVSERESQ